MIEQREFVSPTMERSLKGRLGIAAQDYLVILELLDLESQPCSTFYQA